MKGDYAYDLSYTSIYKQNKKEQIIEEMIIDSKGILKSKQIIHYNLSGDIERQTQFNSEGEPEIKHIYLYE